MDQVLSELSTMTCLSWVALHVMAHSFIELDKAVIRVNVTGDGSKVQCYKEQYCTGTWNVRYMNQGKLEMVKQEMTRVNINILGISDLKWTEIG